MAHQDSASMRACPRCGDESYWTLFRSPDRFGPPDGKRFSVVECGGCALIRLDPMPTPAELAAFYPDTYWWEADATASGRLSEIYRQLVLADHAHFVSHSIESGSLLLDIGCGGGSFARAIGKRGITAVGVDAARRAAGQALRRHNVEAVQGAAPNLPFVPHSFEAVTLFHVLEHVEDPVECLLGAREMLKPGGRLYVQVPNAACWQFLLLGKHWSGVDIPRHLIHFRTEDLEQVLDAADFQVERRKFFSLRDNPAGLATSLCPRLDPVLRRVRRVRESPNLRLVKDLLYLAIVAACVPFTLLEAAGAAGSTVMMEAVARGER